MKYLAVLTIYWNYQVEIFGELLASQITNMRIEDLTNLFETTTSVIFGKKSNKLKWCENEGYITWWKPGKAKFCIAYVYRGFFNHGFQLWTNVNACARSVYGSQICALLRKGQEKTVRLSVVTFSMYISRYLPWERVQKDRLCATIASQSVTLFWYFQIFFSFAMKIIYWAKRLFVKKRNFVWQQNFSQKFKV